MKKSKTISIRLTDDEVKILDELKESTGLKQSELIRKLLRHEPIIINPDKLSSAIFALYNLAKNPGDTVSEDLKGIAAKIFAELDYLLKEVNPDANH